MIKCRFISNFLLINLFLVIFIANAPQINALSKKNEKSQEYIGIIPGDIFRFQYNLLEIGGSKEDAFHTITSVDNDNINLTIKDGDILQIEIVNITETTSFFTNYATVLLTLEDSDQEMIETDLTFGDIYFFAPSSNVSFYQSAVEYYNENSEGFFSSTTTFIANNSFYCQTYYNDNEVFNLEYVEFELYIPKNIVCYMEEKVIELEFENSIEQENDYRYYDHIRIISLDYPIFYSKGYKSIKTDTEEYQSDVIDFLKENLIGLTSNIFFYVILAEIVGFMFLVLALRKKGAF